MIVDEELRILVDHRCRCELKAYDFITHSPVDVRREARVYDSHALNQLQREAPLAAHAQLSQLVPHHIVHGGGA
jgi:hypothetical protein